MRSFRPYRVLSLSLDILLVAVALVLLCSSVSAQSASGVVLTVGNGSEVNGLPGQVSTVSIRIANKTAEELNCLSFVDVPLGWRCLVGAEAFRVESDTAISKLVSFVIPGEAPTGSYEVGYELRSADDGKLLSHATFPVRVMAMFDIELSVLDAPRHAVAGSPYVATFLLENKSNESAQVRFRTRSTPYAAPTLDSSDIWLVPGESRRIHVSVLTDPVIRAQYLHSLELRAMLTADTTIGSTASVMVSILPSVTLNEDYLRVPLELTLRTTGENSHSGSQAQLVGGGSFSEDGHDHYELLARGPNNQTQSLLGERDEYRITYERTEFGASLGDQPFTLSPLTELGRYAFGGSSRFKANKIGLGGFVNQTRWTPEPQKEFGGFATYDIKEATSVGVNFLEKRDTRSSDIFTLFTDIQTFKNTDISMELGSSQSDGKAGKALFIAFRSNAQWIQYAFNQVYADANFSGYYHDFDAKAVNVAVFPWDLLRIEGFFRDEKRNLDKQPQQLYAPYSRQYQTGIGYGNYAAAYLRVTREQDLLPNPKYDRTETVAMMRFAANFQNSSAVANITLGSTHEGMEDHSYPVRRFSLSTGFQPNENQGYSISFEYESLKDLFTIDVREGTTQSITAWYRLTQGLQIQLGFYESWTISPISQTNTLADLQIDYTLPFGHRVSVLGRYNHVSGSPVPDDLAYSLDYVVPLNFAFSRGGGGSMLMGKVADIESGKGMSDVVLYAGEAVAVTDQEGVFRFPALREGTHSLSIDRGSIGPNRISTRILPLQVDMLPGQNGYIDIGISRSCAVFGQVFRPSEEVLLRPDSMKSEQQHLDAFAGATVELKSETEVMRRVTDPRGRFQFSDLRPGVWTVRVVEIGIPEQLEAGSATRTIELKPGQEGNNINLTLQTRTRHLKMIERGKILKQK